MNVLIWKLGAIGDVVYTIPALAALKSRLPDAHITWAVGEASAGLLSGHPLLDRLVIADEQALFAGSRLEQLRAVLRVRRQLDRSYDLILVGHRDLRHSVALRAMGVFGRLFQLTRAAGLRRGLLRTAVPVPPLRVHECLALQRLVQAGVEALAPGTEPAADLAWGWDWSHVPEPRVDLPEHFLAVHPGGGSNARTAFVLKRWPHMRDLVTRTAASGGDVVLVGGADEAEEANRILSGMSESERRQVVNLVGSLTLPDLVGVLRRAAGFVGGDSGPLHIADSLGIPCTGLYGPTSPVSWGLRSNSAQTLTNPVHCAPCYKDDGHFEPCPYQHECMEELSVERVSESVSRFWPA
ncbi:MAG: glycosyltransferase family 9 protein [Candidatus Krumholzibacteriia bacterium]